MQEKDRVNPLKALVYINKIKKFVEKNQIIIKDSKSLVNDFSEMLNADILIFLHGTFSWWAGYIGSQGKVYVSKLWRPQKICNSFLSNYKSSRWIKW